MKRARTLAKALTLLNPGRSAGSADAGLIADVSYRTDLTPYIQTPEQGARMLVISIIRLAIADLTSVSQERSAAEARRSAAVYFQSDQYRAHLRLLGLPYEQPLVVKRLLPENGRRSAIQSRKCCTSPSPLWPTPTD
jgi:hypothetical protein